MLKTPSQAVERRRIKKLADLAVNLMKMGLPEHMVRFNLFEFAERVFGWASTLEEGWAYADAALERAKAQLQAKRRNIYSGRRLKIKARPSHE